MNITIKSLTRELATDYLDFLITGHLQMGILMVLVTARLPIKMRQPLNKWLVSLKKMV